LLASNEERRAEKRKGEKKKKKKNHVHATLTGGKSSPSFSYFCHTKGGRGKERHTYSWRAEERKERLVSFSQGV